MVRVFYIWTIGCVVKNSNFHIDARSTFNEDRGELILSVLERFTHFYVIPKEFKKNSYENLTNLYLELESIRKQSELPHDLDVHDGHHYFLIYIIVFLIITYAINRYVIQRNGIESKVNTLSTMRAISMPNLFIHSELGEC